MLQSDPLDDAVCYTRQRSSLFLRPFKRILMCSLASKVERGHVFTQDLCKHVTCIPEFPHWSGPDVILNRKHEDAGSTEGHQTTVMHGVTPYTTCGICLIMVISPFLKTCRKMNRYLILILICNPQSPWFRTTRG